MKVFLSVDMEGICGIVGETETDPEKGGERYRENCHLMTQETNAAIEGCLEAGAKDVLVADSHWNFNNLLREELHETARLFRGAPRPFSMVEGLDSSFDAALFIGFHAMRGAPRAIIDHTMSGRYRAVQVNGLDVGETALNAYLAGHHGVPVVLVTGDSTLAAEARSFIPGVHTVAVKEPVSAGAAIHLHPKHARARIREEAAKALSERTSIKAVRAKTPVEMAVDFSGTEYADRGELLPGARRVGGTRIEFTAADFREAYRTFEALSFLSGA